MTAVSMELKVSYFPKIPKNLSYYSKIKASNDEIAEEKYLPELLENSAAVLPFIAKTLSEYYIEVKTSFDNQMNEVLIKEQLDSNDVEFLNLYSQIQDYYDILKSYFKDILLARSYVENYLKQDICKECDCNLVRTLADFIELGNIAITFKKLLIKALIFFIPSL